MEMWLWFHLNLFQSIPGVLKNPPNNPQPKAAAVSLLQIHKRVVTLCVVNRLNAAQLLFTHRKHKELFTPLALLLKRHLLIFQTSTFFDMNFIF